MVFNFHHGLLWRERKQSHVIIYVAEQDDMKWSKMADCPPQIPKAVTWPVNLKPGSNLGQLNAISVETVSVLNISSSCLLTASYL